MSAYIDESLILAAKRTREDLGETGDNYPDVRRLLSFAEVAIALQADSEECAEAIADMVAAEAINHIDQMYPAMWSGVPNLARTSLRNIIRNQSARYVSLMRKAIADQPKP